MAVSFYFHRVCPACKRINIRWPRSTSFHGTANALQDSVIISWKNIFLYLIYMEHIFYCECYSDVGNVLKNDLCKLSNTICTFEEEWKTRNKNSFGVTSSPSGQSSLYWSTVVYSLAAVMSTQWVEEEMSFHLPGILNALKVQLNWPALVLINGKWEGQYSWTGKNIGRSPGALLR